MLKQKSPLTVAYFTMEIAVGSDIPTYAGGLGVLAADMMRSCADLGVSAACVTICWRHGYMRQHLDLDGTQRYEDMTWEPEKFMERLKEKVTVKIEGRDVTIGAWRYDIQPSQPLPAPSTLLGINSASAKAGSKPPQPPQPSNTVPIFFLDTNLPENPPGDRDITNHLYGGDGAMRLKQEIVLGIGGVRMLRALGYGDIGTFHMNEGHSAFLTLELLRERDYRDEHVRPSCAFTTHTPIAAGHDVFDYDFARRIAGDVLPWHIRSLAGADHLSMTRLAMNLSSFHCGVSQIHGTVSRNLFQRTDIDAITNGIHHVHWASPEMADLFDRHIAGWRGDPAALDGLCRSLPDGPLWEAHQKAKRRLIDAVNKQTVVPFDTEHLTIASARRIVTYKRPELLYTNLERLKEVTQGRVQIIHAGNAHPDDRFSQEVIRRMIRRSQQLRDCVKIVYLPNYNPDLARLLVQGADVWLNTPMRLHEASGTSGMKACLNGTLNVSTLDGWWAEAYAKDPEAGWRIGPLASAAPPEEHVKLDAEDLYTQLQYEVIPEYCYKGHERWIRRMKRAIGLIGRFNTHRCVKEYLQKAWRA